MKITILLILTLSFMLNAWALVVVTNPYMGLEDEITVYDLNREDYPIYPQEDEPCPEPWRVYGP